MTEIDAVIRDLEAGLFLNELNKSNLDSVPDANGDIRNGLLRITYEGRQVEPRQALIGRDFVAWVDVQGLCIVPGRQAGIRVYRPNGSSAGSARSFELRPKLKLAKYLGGLAGQFVRIETWPVLSKLEGALIAIQGEFLWLNLGSATALVGLAQVRSIVLPVNNFSESSELGLI